jgi:Phage integrase, N-terminal SAM-like domain
MTATATPSTSLVQAEPAFSDQERLPLTGFLAGYSGMTREAYAMDLRQFTAWCHNRRLRLFAVRRADIELFARELETAGRARATMTGRLSTIAGLYKYAVQENLLDYSPAAHVRRPRIDYESHAAGLDRNEAGALLVAAGLGAAAEHTLISPARPQWAARLGGNWFRHRSARHRARPPDADHHPQGRQESRHPARPSYRPRHQPGRQRTLRPADLHRARPGSGSTGTPPGGSSAGSPAAPGKPKDRAAHAQTCLHHRSTRRRRAAARRPGSRLARRPAHHDAV